jgi:hypothetical protein
LSPSLRRLALPVDEQLSRVIADFDCLGESHDGDLVAENVNGFLANRRYEPGLEHGISSTYLFIDPGYGPNAGRLRHADLRFSPAHEL